MKNGSPTASSDVRFFLLLVACATFFASLWLVTAPASAQDDGDDDGDSAAEEQYSQSEGAEDDCPGAQTVDTFTGNGIQTTPLFETKGGSFRITSDVTSTDPNFIFQVFVYDENNELVDIVSQEQEGSSSSFVNEGAGRYYLEINSANTTYTVTVEDCVGGVDDDDNDDQDDDPQEGVIPGTIPEKALVNTGGETVAAGTPVLAALLVAAGLSGVFGATMVGLGRRRG